MAGEILIATTGAVCKVQGNPIDALLTVNNVRGKPAVPVVDASVIGINAV